MPDATGVAGGGANDKLVTQTSQKKDLAQDGMEVTMARWLIKNLETLIPLYNLLQDMVLDSNCLQW